ncbi:MFS general substrate transporter [Xylona heveae TC161]|uniref:MFS general substrate transporter n=1 Tax=Xylona heveae (strain CBS 132557 / TC161) TaxID=1328760 RepID=A0A165H0I3_XYLHT|nr:MFS general substrate transporter [Xylona heveae TC161]KZF22834.1 MFS general substrate transporter [Xylona heveae TC161]
MSSLVVQAEVYHKTTTQMSYSVSSALAGLIAGPLIFVPLAQVIGTSSCIFWSLLGSFACCIWSATCTGQGDYMSFTISRLIGGLFASIPQCLGNGAIVNLFFLHQRGKAFAIFSTCFTLGTVAGPTFSGFIISHQSFAVEYWWIVALLGICAVLVFFFLEETGFNRDRTAAYPHVPESFIPKKIATFFPGTQVVPHITGQQLTRFIVAPYLIGFSPAGICVGIFGMTLFGFFILINSQLAIFLQPPVIAGGYGFTPQRNAAFLFCIWFGILCAQASAHFLNDRLPMWFCKRRGGVWKPEYRLQTLWLTGVILMPVGLGIFGACLQYHEHYMVLALASFLIAYAACSSVAVPINYLVESFAGNPQEVGTVMNGYRLALGLAINFFTEPWEKSVGIGWVFGMAAFFSLGSFLLVILLMWKGHVIRQWSYGGIGKTDDGAKVVDAKTAGDA